MPLAVFDGGAFPGWLGGWVAHALIFDYLGIPASQVFPHPFQPLLHDTFGGGKFVDVFVRLDDGCIWMALSALEGPMPRTSFNSKEFAVFRFMGCTSRLAGDKRKDSGLPAIRSGSNAAREREPPSPHEYSSRIYKIGLVANI